MVISIQYLRAIAAIGVVIAHTLGIWGDQGVDIFFVISGYLMMYLIANVPRPANVFFLARYTRIAPLYYFLTIVAIVAGSAFEPTLAHIIQSVLFIKYQWSAPVLTVGWTLDYEFVFYSVCSLALVATKDVRLVAVLVSSILFAGTFVLDFVLYPDKKYGHFIEFWYGIVIFFILQKISAVNFSSRTMINPFKMHVLLGLIALVFVIGFFSPYTHDENGKAYLRFLTYGIPAALLVFLSILYEKLHGLPTIKIVTLLGAASYSIYLSHPITLHLYYGGLDTAMHSNPLVDLTGTLLSVLVGVFVYKLVEKPLYKITHRYVESLSKNSPKMQ